jgi:uncharacterized protein
MLAVITGASSGIGASFARKLAAQRFDLLLIARRKDRLESLARELSAQHQISAEVFQADLTDATVLEAAAERIRKAPNLGILVNNAGFGTHGYFFEADVASQVQMHLLHVVATTRLSHAALANLVPRGAPGMGVINVSSIAAFGVSPTNVSYNATKAWMNAFTEGLAVELAGRSSPVTVQALCPGFTLSEFHDVVGMLRSAIPQWLWMPPDFVVDESLRGFERRKIIVIPGWHYKLMTGLLRATPRALVRALSGGMVRRYRKRKQASGAGVPT